MRQDDVIRLVTEAGIKNATAPSGTVGDYFWGTPHQIEAFAKLVAEDVSERYMQLFLDPENQPTQFGTATQEYREQEIAEVRDLLFELAHRIRTTHLYGMEVQKMLEQAEAIKTRGQA